MHHHPHFAGIAVDLHFQKMVATTDGSELWTGFHVSRGDIIELDALGDRDVLPLAYIRFDVDRLRSMAQDLVDLRRRNAGRKRRTARPYAGCDAPLDRLDPRPAPLSAG